MTREKKIKNTVEQFMKEIETVDNDFIGEVIGVAQAIGGLKEALEKINKCLDQRQFEKASNLGYSDVSSEFIFLQRTLGGLNHTVSQKDKIIQDICIELCSELENLSYEEVAPLVEKKMTSLEPIKNPMKIEISIGKKTVEKLLSLQNIRHTPIEHLVERIIASAMKNNEQFWQEQENSKPSIPNIRHEEKEFYTSDESFDHIKALGKQEKERSKNLY